VIAVTGKMALYGNKLPNPTWTRLYAYAQKGAQTVVVDIDPTSAHGWTVGDYIVFGPTNYNPAEYEKRRIVAVAADANTGRLSLTLDSALSFDHYGDNQITVGPSNAKKIIDPSFGGTIDMRGTVGHITRSIVISGTNEDTWGGHVLVYYWFDDTNNIDKRGNV
jgi:hypothetical protein